VIPAAAPPLDRIVAAAERLLARSPADATVVSWTELRRGSALESARARRADAVAGREVVVRVRVAGRTGAARTEGDGAGELETALRSAMAAARGAEPSPDWDVAASAGALPDLPGLFDPDLAALEPAAAQQAIEQRAERRATVELAWREKAVVVAASFHPTRAARLTAVTAAVRSGRRPGSGFAAGSARSLAGLDLESLIERARGLEAPESVAGAPALPVPMVLSPEAVCSLLEAWGRQALAARAGRPAARPTAPGLRIDDDPLAAHGLPLPFDLDGAPRARRPFVEGGRLLGAAFDLDLAARAGVSPTAHGLASDDAWPIHLVLRPGDAPEAALRARAAGGLRVGALERLAVSSDDAALSFRALARNLRRIDADGSLGAAVAPLVWNGSLGEVLAAVEEVGAESVSWSPRSGLPGAPTAAPLRLSPVGGLGPPR